MVEFSAVAFLGLLMAPVMLIWGWIRWSRRPQGRDVLSMASLLALVLASTSAITAIGGIVYSAFIDPFRYYDPRLMRVMGLGSLIAALGILLGIVGVWRQNPLRWHGLLSAVGMLAFWVTAAALE